MAKHRADSRDSAHDKAWSLVDVGGLTVVDFGAGKSTKRLLQMGANVIAVDRDLERLKEFVDAGVPVVVCDFVDFPFRCRFADLAVFHFSLHEVDPARHHDIVTMARQIAPRILIIEPSPEGGLAFRRFYELWREAMESVGRFEEYKSLEYWRGLVESCGFDVELSERAVQDYPIPRDEVEKLAREAVDLWRRLGVPESIVREMLEFPGYVERVGGMWWSDLLVVLGLDRERV